MLLGLYIWIGRSIGDLAVSGLWSLGSTGVSGSGSHSHLFLKVHLRKLVAFLAILYLSVALVDEVIAGSDMVVSVVFDALLAVLAVEVELLQNVVEELLLHWHFLFAWKQTRISESVLHLQRPCVVANVTH